MIFKYKRGLSTVVTTLIVILLVLIAIAIIWLVIGRLIGSGAEKVDLGKFTLSLELLSAKTSGTNDIEVVVKRKAGEGELTGINFILENANGETEIIKNDAIGSFQELEEKTFTITPTNLILTDIVKVSIAPIIKTSSGKEEALDIVSEIDVG